MPRSSIYIEVPENTGFPRYPGDWLQHLPVTGNRERPDRPAPAAYHEGFIHDMFGGVCPGEFSGPVIMKGLGNARSIGEDNRDPIRVVPGMDAINPQGVFQNGNFQCQLNFKKRMYEKHVQEEEKKRCFPTAEK
jgi:hypothetical protein